MTQAKHTAGPWQVHRNIGRKSEIGVVADAAPCIIAVMGNAKEWPVEADANARLIASAPDLLEACKALMAQLQAKGFTAPEGTFCPADWYEDQKRAAAAIARAERSAV